MKRSAIAVGLVLCLGLACRPAPAAESASASPAAPDGPPDLTKTIDFERQGQYYLGPTGASGWMYVNKYYKTDQARQILVTEIQPGSPADGVLEVGDVILGVEGRYFQDDARKELGWAIDRAESAANKGRLRLLLWRPDKQARPRRGRELTVTLQLRVLGSYSPSAPFDCPKTRKILEDALKVLVEQDDWGQFGIKALAFLATGEKPYIDRVRQFIHQAKWARPDIRISVESGGLITWSVGYHNLILTEYYLATGDKYVLPAIREYSVKAAMGQSAAGTWGHGFAWTKMNDGRLHGHCVGYGALNQAGLPCFLSLILAQKCGIDHPEIDLAIARSRQFFHQFVGKGSIGYGFHRPSLEIHCNGRNGMSGNGKNAIAAVAFRLLDDRDSTRFFSRLTASLYKTCEYGHSGNSYSYFWDPLGAACTGPKTVAAFYKQLRWYYTLTRMPDGRFVNQPLGGFYGRGLLDPTVAHVLLATLPRRAIYLTGKQSDPSWWLDDKQVAQTIDAGRWRRADTSHLTADQLIDALDNWSPIAREWIAMALADKPGNPLPRLLDMLDSPSPQARAGACAALGYLGPRAAQAVPRLTDMLSGQPDIVTIAAGYALARIRPPASQAVEPLMRAALAADQPHPMRPTQQALTYALGYAPSHTAPLYFTGLLPALAEKGNPLENFQDRDLLYRFTAELLANPSARVRGCAAYLLNHFSRRDLAHLAQPVFDAARSLPPNYMMFRDMARGTALKLLARYRVAEALPLALQTFDLDRWGSGTRITNRLEVLQSFASAARPLLPDLYALKKKIRNPEQLQLLDKTIQTIQQDKRPPRLVLLADLVDQEIVRPALAGADSNEQKIRTCRQLMDSRPDDGFLRSACLAHLARLAKPKASTKPPRKKRPAARPAPSGPAT